MTIKRLKLFVEREGALFDRACFRCGRARRHARFLVVRHALLEKVCLAFDRDHVHKVERVRYVVDFLVAERDEQSIRDKFNVPVNRRVSIVCVRLLIGVHALAHELAVHADEVDRQRVCQELLFNLDSFGDDAFDRVRVRSSLEM